MVSIASCVAESDASIAISITRIKFCVNRTRFFDGKDFTTTVSFDKHLEILSVIYIKQFNTKSLIIPYFLFTKIKFNSIKVKYQIK